MTQSSRELNRRGETTRARIISQSKRTFRAYGWGTSRAHIAKAMGCSNATIVNYFPTREGLVRTVYAEELGVLRQSTEKTIDELVSTTNGSYASLVTRFVESVGEAFACRPVLAMTFLPYLSDPWQPTSGKVPTSDTPTFDSLTRDFASVLIKYWESIGESYTKQQVYEEAKILMLGMLGGAANKLTAPAITEPVLRAVL